MLGAIWFDLCLEVRYIYILTSIIYASHGAAITGDSLLCCSDIAHESETAETCEEILDNGLYINLTYRLHDDLARNDFFQNCCEFYSAVFFLRLFVSFRCVLFSLG